MIHYPHSELGEMSLEEHSQCECRCPPVAWGASWVWVLRVLGVVVSIFGGPWEDANSSHPLLSILCLMFQTQEERTACS